MRIGAPVELNRVIARRAVQNARQDMRGRSWTSTGALQPFSEVGQVGISSTMKHLLIQNKGFDPFVMWWVEGRRVSIKGANGQTNVVLGKEPGKPGYVNIPGRGKVWRDQRWRHPGIRPQRFLEKAIQGAIKESRQDIQGAAMDILRGNKL